MHRKRLQDLHNSLLAAGNILLLHELHMGQSGKLGQGAVRNARREREFRYVAVNNRRCSVHAELRRPRYIGVRLKCIIAK